MKIKWIYDGFESIPTHEETNHLERMALGIISGHSQGKVTSTKSTIFEEILSLRAVIDERKKPPQTYIVKKDLLLDWPDEDFVRVMVFHCVYNPKDEMDNDDNESRTYEVVISKPETKVVHEKDEFIFESDDDYEDEEVDDDEG